MKFIIYLALLLDAVEECEKTKIMKTIKMTMIMNDDDDNDDDDDYE